MPYISHGVSFLPKDCKIKQFWLIIAGVSPLYKGDGGRGSIFQKNRGVNFPPKNGEVIMRVIYDCFLTLCL